MAPTAVSMLVTQIQIGGNTKPRRWTGLAGDHFRHYLSRVDAWPAVVIDVKDGVPVLIRGLDVVEEAKAIGRDRVTATVALDVPASEISRLLRLPGVVRLDWDDIMDRSVQPAIGWLVFFLADGVTAEEATLLRNQVRRELQRHVGQPMEDQFNWDPASGLVEFKAIVPAGEAWMTELLRVVRRFNEEVRKVTSFQGEPWELGTQRSD